MSKSYSVDDYVSQFNALLPVGRLWRSLKQNDTVMKLIEAFSVEFFRINSRSVALCDEIDPGKANEIFNEWETFAGLPDPCVGELTTMAERRAAVIAKLTATGGQSRQYFIDLAAAVGFSITISEYDGVNPALIDQFYWQVNGSLSGPSISFRVNSRVEDRLLFWPSNASLECMINRLKPAHTTVVFKYT